jgi:hypothetical protein
VNITVTPVGSSYLQNAQNGSCTSTGVTSNALAAADLAFDIRNSANTIIFRSVNANAAGLAETTTGLLLSPAGNFNIRVFQSGSQTESQLYKLSITVQNANLSPTASDGTFTGFVRVTWPSTITDADSYQVLRNTTNTTSNASLLGTITGTTFTYDDTTAVPGTTYYYFVKARQPGSTGYRYMTATGDAGSRGVSNQSPVANAGSDQTVTDSDRTGSEVVTLNGSASSDPDGTISNYRWAEGAATLATGSSPTANVNLAVGTHLITLTVTDNLAAVASDTVTITVNPGCFADYNLDGGVDGADIDAFFADWSLGRSQADANSDGGIDGSDIEAFFVVWELGGC